MAGLKKPVKKRDGTKPSTVLIIFLVLFFLMSVGLGVWGYYGYAGQDDLRKAAVTAAQKEKAAQIAEDYQRFLADDLRYALGVPPEGEEVARYTALLEEFSNETSKFKAEASYENVKAMREHLLAALGADGKQYAKNYKSLVAEYQKQVAAATSQAEFARFQAKDDKLKYETLLVKQEAYQKDMSAKLQSYTSASLTAVGKRTKEFEDLSTKYAETISNDDKRSDQVEEQRRKLEAQIKQLNTQLAEALQEKIEFKQSPGGDVHALILDISRGKTLWDNPIGKITRVSFAERTVNINLGSKQGVKEGLTFVVFAAGWNGRAEKEMKGTIEVTRVQGESVSLARITSLYEADGTEINLNDPARLRLQNEAKASFKEGDLLFNMLWGTHVAVAGNIGLDGPLPQTPSEQSQSLNEFLVLMNRQGIIVDAYLDPTNAKVNGAVGKKTRYFIRGADFLAVTNPLVKVDPTAEPSERLKNLADAIAGMKKEAVEKGMFIISVENFANVMGYRPAQSASASTARIGDFRPGPVIAGSGITGSFTQVPEKQGP